MPMLDEGVNEALRDFMGGSIREFPSVDAPMMQD